MVGVDELLAEADGLADREVFGDDVGLTDLVGLGLPVGLGDTDGCSLTRVGLGVGLGCGLVWCEGVALGELRCCAVLLPTSPLPRPER